MSVELDQLQGLIARAYPALRAATYVLLAIDDANAARAWLGSLLVTPAPVRQPDGALNVALSASAFHTLGLPEEVLQQFSNEFVAGMTTPHRRRMLGDVGQSAPERWLWGGPSTPAVDVLLMLFAADEAALADDYASVAAGYSGVTELTRLDAVVDLDGHEHFGFADGISQPTIAGLSSRTDLPSNTIQPGEVILGYKNEYGRLTEHPPLARNGSYLVFRQLSQDVRGFWRYIDQATGGDATRRTWLAAKMVGRWPSGAPLTLTPEVDDPLLATANDFMYEQFDEFGMKCPVAAHVRRAHPRDSLDPDPGTERSVSLDRRHRLLRRGREYGPPIADPFSERPPDDPDRGLYFICLCANIGRQFEFVQHTWLNNPKFAERYAEPDPIVGYHPPGAATFTVPADPVRERYDNLPQFVTTRGGGYFFLPSIATLRSLAS
jgi:Dyp-type peroxidase family